MADDATHNDAAAAEDNGKPFAKVTSSISIEQTNEGKEERKAVNVDEDSEPEEEEPLPPHLNPAGIYTAMLTKKRKLVHAAAPFVSLPPKTIGGLQDQVFPKASCGCRNSQCLVLYCDCFASSVLCTGLCKCQEVCFNDGAAEHEMQRTRKIMNIIGITPFAFRRTEKQLTEASAAAINEFMSNNQISIITASGTPNRSCSCNKSRCLKYYCACWNQGAYCHSKCRCNSCSNRPGDTYRERLMEARRKKDPLLTTKSRLPVAAAFAGNGHPGTVSTVATKSTKNGNSSNKNNGRPITLPPSGFATPVRVEGKIVQGLSFGRALPTERHGDKDSRASPTSRRLYHNLMLSPSRVGARRKDLSMENAVGTELETAWAKETGEVRDFFSFMREKIETRKQDEIEEHILQKDDPAEKRALSVLESVEEDVKNADRLIEAAELDILTRLRERKRRSSFQDAELMSDEDSNEELADLKCSEEIMLPKTDRLNKPALKELTILAAQDTALLRETARIIRRKARELCEQRMLNDDNGRDR